ncbi:cytochrome P450 1A1 [Rhypophila decipiens]
MMEGLALVLLYLAIPSLLISAVQQILSWRKKTLGSEPKFPGPQQFPIVGRVHDLPRFSMWLKFKEWADIHGPIYQTHALNQTFIVISDEKIAEELLVKRGHIYSGRPQIRSLIKHKDGPAYSALMDRHDIWKNQRKWCHAAMAEAYKHHFYGHVEREMKRFLGLMLLDPARFLDYTREYCGRVMSRLAWDEATQGRANGESADQTLHCMSVSGPITNTMTPLWYLPAFANPWYKFEIERESTQRAWWLNNLRLAKDRYRRGELPNDTWAYRYFEQIAREGNPNLDQEEEQEVFASCMIGFLNLVGVVTISGPLKFFLMAMGLHPEWQKKAQNEIDRVCGDRMPTMQDFPNLPTVRACLKETVRWRSGVPLGVPHQAERDDEYRGVKIKKGTIVLACEWTINRVPEKYPDGENFRPERWLDPSWPTYQEPLTRYPNFREGHAMHTFGWGRRTCLGQNIVDDEMFVFGAASLWAFNSAPRTCPKTGEVIPIDTQATNSHVILEPNHYQMAFKPRSEERARQILEGYSSVLGELKL